MINPTDCQRHACTNLSNTSDHGGIGGKDIG